MNNEKDTVVEIQETKEIQVTECDATEVCPQAAKQDRLNGFKRGLVQFGKKTSEISQKTATTIAEQTKIGLKNRKRNGTTLCSPKSSRTRVFIFPILSRL